jgi:hypothetical protein
MTASYWTHFSFSIVPADINGPNDVPPPEKCDRETCAQKPSHIVDILHTKPNVAEYDHTIRFFCLDCTEKFLIAAANRIHQLKPLQVAPTRENGQKPDPKTARPTANR